LLLKPRHLVEIARRNTRRVVVERLPAHFLRVCKRFTGLLAQFVAHVLQHFVLRAPLVHKAGGALAKLCSEAR